MANAGAAARVLPGMTNHLLTLLAEGFEGPQGTRTCFLDGPDSGLRATLAKLSAADASKDVGGNSIAAHAHHLLFGCDAFTAYVRGDWKSRDWNESWRVSTVTDGEWSKLQEDLSQSYKTLYDAVAAAEGDDQIHGAFVGAAHLIYHLGAIRQKAISLR
jgi:hypothetical protein